MRSRALIVLSLFVISIFSAAETSAKKYPLEVSVLSVSGTPGSKMKSGSGKADVKEGGDYSGLDFTYDCARPFLSYGLDQPYPGVWKEKGKVLTISVTKIGDA